MMTVTYVGLKIMFRKLADKTMGINRTMTAFIVAALEFVMQAILSKKEQQHTAIVTIATAKLYA